MGNVLKGLGFLGVGFIIWVVFSVIAGISEGLGEEAGGMDVGMYIGFAIMVLGPVYYWIFKPIKNRISSEEEEKS